MVCDVPVWVATVYLREVVQSFRLLFDKGFNHRFDL